MKILLTEIAAQYGRQLTQSEWSALLRSTRSVTTPAPAPTPARVELILPTRGGKLVRRGE